jgi:Ni/Fe-hydrogenase subunit HybB-like protein
MNAASSLRVAVTKAVLWLLVGIATAIALSRYLRGLGATTALSDATPWGLWIGFDVLSGVALAAGGFVLAATVYIFHLDRYHGMVRAAVLTAFLGYIAVALGLLVDLGRPWNIWRMIFFWQPHSPLFEVGWCVMLYLTVLALEFVPVVFEGLGMSKAFRFMKRLTIPLVIAGIGLSTLHQSSLGTLFLLTEDRMHPLWYSPLLPLLFFVSAVGLGLAMVSSEAISTSWLYRKKGEWDLIRGLTRACAYVLLIYLALRFGDLAVRGKLHHLLDGSWATALFAVEILMSAVIPFLLFSLPSTRSKPWGLTTGAFLCAAGFVLHRADVGGITHIPVTGVPYLPALTEIFISLGLVAAMALIFLFFVERFPVWETKPAPVEHFTPPIADPVSRAFFGGPWFGRVQLQAVGWIIGCVVGALLLEATTSGGEAPRSTGVRPARAAAAVRVTAEADQSQGHLQLMAEPAPGVPLPDGFTTALLIDGDRQGKTVLFDHKDHQRRLGGEASCSTCHHLNLRLERGTPCSVCHRDMYRCTDTFNHQAHVEVLAGNQSCARCHCDPAAAKTRADATDCAECHRNQGQATKATPDDLPEAAASCMDCHTRYAHTTYTSMPSPESVRGIAPGYRRAMHRLCIRCHSAHEQKISVEEPQLTRCTTCHRHHQDPEPMKQLAQSQGVGPNSTGVM